MVERGALPKIQTKLVLLGDSGVGKTALSQVYAGRPYQVGYRPTVGVDFSVKAVVIAAGGVWQWQIWDFSGKPNYQTVRSRFYQGAEGVLLVYDVSQPISLTRLQDWLKELYARVSTEIPVLVVGNRVDLRETETTCLTTEQGREAVKQLEEQFALPKMGLVETSAKTPMKVTKAFDELRTLIQEKKTEKRHYYPNDTLFRFRRS